MEEKKCLGKLSNVNENDSRLTRSCKKATLFFFSFLFLCMILAFPPHPFAYFLSSGYLLRAPDNDPITRTFFGFPRRFELSGVDCIAFFDGCWWLLMAVSWGICLKLNYSRHQIKRTLLQSFPPLFSAFPFVKKSIKEFSVSFIKKWKNSTKKAGEQA